MSLKNEEHMIQDTFDLTYTIRAIEIDSRGGVVPNGTLCTREPVESEFEKISQSSWYLWKA